MSRLDGIRNQAALALVGVMQIAHAGMVWLDPGEMNPDRAVIYELWPIELRVGLWLGCGLAALTLAPTRWRAAGWMLVMAMPLERALSHTWSLIMWIIPGWPPGMIASGAYATYWATLAGLLYILPGWADLKPPPPAGGTQ